MRRWDREVMGQLLEALAYTDGRWRGNPLTVFAGLRGSEDAEQLMVVGRAVNGWTSRWYADDARNTEERRRILDRAFSATEWNEGRPMLWVADSWGAPQGSNTRRSAFWRVVRGTVGRLGLADVSDRTWPLALCWTNLYKVAPFAGGNPSKSLAAAQLENCIKVLQIEATDWTPRRLLFLTGLSWARPFLEGIGWERQGDGHPGEVEAVGSIPSGTRLVVAPHPQGRSEGRLVMAIAEAFRT